MALDAGWITMDELQVIVPQARAKKIPFAKALLDRGLDSDRITYLQACSEGLPFARPDQMRIAPSVLLVIAVPIQKKYRVIPLLVRSVAGQQSVYVAMIPEVAASLSQHLSKLIGMNVVPVAATSDSIARALELSAGRGFQNPSLPNASEFDFDRPAGPQAYRRAQPAEAAGRANGTTGLITTLADF